MIVVKPHMNSKFCHVFFTYAYLHLQQGCIPVGCVPPAAVAVTPPPPRSRHPPGADPSPWEQAPPRADPPEAGTSLGADPPGADPL